MDHFIQVEKGDDRLKKKYIAIGLMTVMAFAIGIWWFLRPVVLGNMDHTCTRPKTSASAVSFSGEAGDRIKLSFTSNIENGDLDINVYHAKGAVVKELDRAKRLETFITLGDTYTLEANYKGFIGHFQITVYKES